MANGPGDVALFLAGHTTAPPFALPPPARRRRGAYYVNGSPDDPTTELRYVTSSPGPEWELLDRRNLADFRHRRGLAVQRATAAALGQPISEFMPPPPAVSAPAVVVGMDFGVRPDRVRRRRPRVSRFARPARKPRPPRAPRPKRRRRAPRPPRPARKPRTPRPPRPAPKDNTLKLWQLNCPSGRVPMGGSPYTWAVEKPPAPFDIDGTRCTWELAAGCTGATGKFLENLARRLFGERPLPPVLEEVRRDPNEARRAARQRFIAQLRTQSARTPVPTPPERANCPCGVGQVALWHLVCPPGDTLGFAFRHTWAICLPPAPFTSQGNRCTWEFVCCSGDPNCQPS